MPLFALFQATFSEDLFLSVYIWMCASCEFLKFICEEGLQNHRTVFKMEKKSQKVRRTMYKEILKQSQK